MPRHWPGQQKLGRPVILFLGNHVNSPHYGKTAGDQGYEKYKIGGIKAHDVAPRLELKFRAFRKPSGIDPNISATESIIGVMVEFTIKIRIR